MVIRRVQIEGGFLDGFDEEFRSGLVTIIGPRGTGKTSLIELIRFGLGVQRLTDVGDQYLHAKSILDSGEIRITVEVEDESIEFVRGAQDVRPKGGESLTTDPPLILAQNEIEVLGSDPQGQLNLIDGFREKSSGESAELAQLNLKIRDSTEDIATLVSEIASLSDEAERVEDIASVQEEAKELKAALKSGKAESKPVRTELEKLSKQLTKVKLANKLVEDDIDATEEWIDSIKEILEEQPRLRGRHEATTESQGLKKKLEEASKSVEHAISLAAEGAAATALMLKEGRESEFGLESRARQLRKDLEALDEGAGAVSRRVAEIEQLIATSESWAEESKELEKVLAGKNQAREKLLDKAEKVRERRFEERAAIVEDLNSKLMPSISVELVRSGNFAGYADALSDLLVGSKIQYKKLVPMIASQVSPIELGKFAETGNAEALASATGIELERAGRLLAYLSEAGAASLFTAPIDDAIEISLLDGSELKSTRELSTGQRCTAVLPILLSDPDGGLIVDQPEDHLDNKFIVDTVIKALKDRKQSGQLIFSTHNANVPVLGGADQVVALGSNGKRGFVDEVGALDDDEIVEVISSVMEGGTEAFEMRAKFYSEHLDNG